MSQALQGINTIHTPRKHIVPTHLNVPDQVLTLWSLSLSARQLLLLLVGAGIGGTVWQHLAVLGHHALAGQALRLLVLLRYQLRPKRYLWRSIRHFEQHLSSLTLERDAPDREEGVRLNALTSTERKRR